MNFSTLIASAAMLLVSQGQAPLQTKVTPQITGDYCEVRTASVFAGACHFNGEFGSGGRDALVAMNIASGKWNGVDLSGVRLIADIACEDNLAIDKAVRKSEIVIDRAASDAQASAVSEMLRAKFPGALGKVNAVRRASVSFTHKDGYRVSADGFASYKVQGMPDDECCKMPGMVWYSSLIPLKDHKVGFTETAAYTAGTNSDRWERSTENSAIYGSFAF